MVKFLDVLGRYEAAEFSQFEAAELLGVGGAEIPALAAALRRGRRVGSFGSAAREDFWQAGAARPGGRSRSALPDKVRRLHGEAFSRASGARSQVCLGLHLDENIPAIERLLVKAKTRGAHRRKRPRRPLPV